MSKALLERKCHEKNLDRIHHDYHGYRDHHHPRPSRSPSRSLGFARTRLTTLPTALIGALGGACSGLAFLLNAKTNGNKGL